MHFKYDFPRYTYNDYKNWKEDWELIDGFPLQFLPSPTAKHNKIQGSLFFQAKLAFQKNKANCVCEIFTELDWKISEETVVRPDLMIVCGKSLTDYLEFPPVLIIEIISPSSVKKDRVIKFDLYREQGVKYYILADYIKETVEVFQLIDNFYKQINGSSFQIDKDCLVDFDFEEIWK
jgi:Uma2 family endonuclease